MWSYCYHHSGHLAYAPIIVSVSRLSGSHQWSLSLSHCRWSSLCHPHPYSICCSHCSLSFLIVVIMVYSWPMHPCMLYHMHTLSLIGHLPSMPYNGSHTQVVVSHHRYLAYHHVTGSTHLVPHMSQSTQNISMRHTCVMHTYASIYWSPIRCLTVWFWLYYVWVTMGPLLVSHTLFPSTITSLIIIIQATPAFLIHTFAHSSSCYS